MNFLIAAIAFLLGGVTVILIEIFKLDAFLTGIRDFLSMLLG